MSLLLTLLAAVTPTADEQPFDDWENEIVEEAALEENTYPVDEVLGAFATACSGIEIPAVAQASLTAAGWESIQPAADSRIGRIMAGGKAAMEAENAADPGGPQATIFEGGVYRKDVAGRELFAIVSGAAFDEVKSYGCRVYDLDASAAIPSERLEIWAVRAPQGVFTGLPGATKHVWNPGLKPGHMEMEVSYVPAGSKLPPPVENVPLSGIVMTASVMEIGEL